MPRLTKKLVKQQFEWTNECYKQALIDVFGHTLTKEEKTLRTEVLRKLLLEREWDKEENAHPLVEGRYRFPEEVNQRYLVHICRLPTDQIEIIIDAYNKGKFNRSPTTIDVLLSELLERATNSETSSTHE